MSFGISCSLAGPGDSVTAAAPLQLARLGHETRPAARLPCLIPFTAVLSLIRGHVTAYTCCPHCGKRPTSGNDPIALLVNQILAQPAHRDRHARTSGRTPFQRQNWHTEEVTYTMTIVPSNLPQADIRPGS
jgi:hypothetical protein